MSLVERKNQIRNAYRLTGKNSFYDGMITGTTFWGRFVCHLVWDMNAKENSEYLMRALSGIPENFFGTAFGSSRGDGCPYNAVISNVTRCRNRVPGLFAGHDGQGREKSKETET